MEYLMLTIFFHKYQLSKVVLLNFIILFGLYELFLYFFISFFVQHMTHCVTKSSMPSALWQWVAISGLPRRKTKQIAYS